MVNTPVELQLNVTSRNPAKKSSRKLSRLGQVPAVVYGSTIKNLCISLPKNSATKYSHSSFDNKIFTLLSEEKSINGLKVIKKDVTYHRLSKDPIHIDFLALDMSKAIRVTVEIKFSGKAKGVKESGGVFTVLKRNIEIECLPNEIPSSFEVDVSSLDIHESYHVSDIQISKQFKLITKPTEAICSVMDAQEEETLKETATSTSAEDASKAGDKTKDENKTSSDSANKDKSK